MRSKDETTLSSLTLKAPTNDTMKNIINNIIICKNKKYRPTENNVCCKSIKTKILKV